MSSLGEGDTNGQESGGNSGETHLELDSKGYKERTRVQVELAKDEVTDSRLQIRKIVRHRWRSRERKYRTYPARGALVAKRTSSTRGKEDEGRWALCGFLWADAERSPWKQSFSILRPARHGPITLTGAFLPAWPPPRLPESDDSERPPMPSTAISCLLCTYHTSLIHDAVQILHHCHRALSLAGVRAAKKVASPEPKP